MSDPDFLTGLDRMVSQAREQLTQQVQRTEALVQLLNRAVALQAERSYPIDVGDLRADAASRGELELAELQATLTRASAQETS